MDLQALLADLGRRLRAARERSGLSVSALASAAGISRRYVTEAEAGRANLSIGKLAALASALEVPLAELVDVTPGVSRGRRYALVGLRGAGKSTVGARLAQALEVPFEELDRRIEDLAGMDLAEVFALHGAEGFHQWEAEALERVLSVGGGLVLATGGSIVDAPPNFARLREACHTIWLRARPEDHFQRVVDQGDRRPMLDRPRAMDELRELCDRREPLYARCHFHVQTSGKDPARIAREVQEIIGAAGGFQGC